MAESDLTKHGPGFDLPDHPLVDAARRVADEVLEPAASAVDEQGVPPSHLRALAAAGLFGLEAPEEGGPLPRPVVRGVVEVLAGADATTWLVWAQHHGPVRALAQSSSSLREELLPELTSGSQIAGIAFSHLRRFPARPVTAEQVEGGWRFDGDTPWYTGWGLNQWLMLAGATAGGEVVFVLTEALEREGMSASPLRLAAMQGSHTVRLSFRGLEVPEDRVLIRRSFDGWAAQDRVGTANVNPACFGLTRTAIRLLAGRAREAGDAVDRCAHRLAERFVAVREEAYRLIDEVPAEEAIERRLAVRAEALEAMVDATTALVTASAGAGMASSSPAQRLARDALFLVVQAQTPAVRNATLDRITRR
ncbi:MAG TPA: acyl-CoA dehydrogenase family protein [Candidatus Dormibacteraeota bacterium]|nr:acyl-CoA dehydrogenase family protein [Candidatus Dormibacteraeota bacterium]